MFSGADFASASTALWAAREEFSGIKFALKVGAAASTAETDGGLPLGSIVLMDYLEDPSSAPLYSYNDATVLNPTRATTLEDARHEYAIGDR